MHQRFADAINQDPDNRDLQLIYADWLDGQGDPRAEGWRVLIEKGRISEFWVDCWSNWNWQADAFQGFPYREWKQFWDDLVFQTDFPTFHAAMDAAAIAWVRCHRDPEFMRETEEAKG
jgi:uncharacterized protein (TIGR02996 family)